jgi:hypothetical protein
MASASNKDLLTTVSNISNDKALRSLAESYGLNINSVSWEDTGRLKGSCWGPNISDMTLSTRDTCMPMIRKPNFADVTADMKIDSFTVPVGNESGTDVKRIPLKEYLQNIGKYTGNDKTKSLFDEKKDTTILVSAQFCVLPLHEGEVKFGVQLFNYQSYDDNPAVLVVIVSQEGTSAQIVMERRQMLYFNKKGRAFNFSAKRLSQDRKEKGKAVKGEMDADEQERNALMVFQIPLKVKERPRRASNGVAYAMCSMENCVSRGISFDDEEEAEMGIEDAVLSVGDEIGEFTGTKGSSGQHLALERDSDYPIRCTLQFYQVTDSAKIAESVFKHMGSKIDNVYKTGSATGSLVFGKSDRPTEPVLGDKAIAQTVMGIENAFKTPVVVTKPVSGPPLFGFFKNSAQTTSQ